MKPSVSIIIVARNEEAKLADTLRAAATAARLIGGAEIIVADSASTDATAGIALAHGARVVRLRNEWELSASAGRYIGTLHASGEFLLFIDADTLVDAEFPREALAEFERDPKLAGVCGFLDDSLESGDDDPDQRLVFEDRRTEIVDVEWMRGGCCFYRKSAILAVGSFNPYLLAEEEADIGIRLRRDGWKLRMLPIPMAVHTRCTEDLSGRSLLTHLSRSLLSGRLGGTTRTLGYAIKNGYGLEFCRLRMPTAVFFALWLVFVAALVILPGYWVHRAALVAGILGFALVFLKKRSLSKTLLFFVAKVMYAVNLFAGIGKLRFTPTSDYPTDAELLEPSTTSVGYRLQPDSVRQTPLTT